MPNPNFNEVQNRFRLVAMIAPDFANLVVIQEKTTKQFEYNI